MSIVAWDGKTIAADRQVTLGELITRGSKIMQLSNGDVVAFTGAAAFGLAMVEWYENGADPATFPASQKTDDWSRLIVVPAKGRPFTYETLPVKISANDKFQAWGSGRDFALGAMEMGASAVQAVKVATRFCARCGMGVDSFRVR